MSSVRLSGNAGGTGIFTIESPNSNNNRTVSIPDGTGTMVVNNANSAIVSGTSQASTSGTFIDFTGIPSWVKRITVMLSGVSTNGTSNFLVQLGDSGGIETTGYDTTAVSAVGAASAASAAQPGTGLQLTTGGAILAGTFTSGIITINNISTFGWVMSTSNSQQGATVASCFANTSKTLSATLDRVRITTVNGTDTFDAGTINILYE